MFKTSFVPPEKNNNLMHNRFATQRNNKVTLAYLTLKKENMEEVQKKIIRNEPEAVIDNVNGSRERNRNQYG